MLCEIRLIPDGEIGITPDFGSGISRSSRGWGIFNTHALRINTDKDVYLYIWWMQLAQ